MAISLPSSAAAGRPSPARPALHARCPALSLSPARPAVMQACACASRRPASQATAAAARPLESAAAAADATSPPSLASLSPPSPSGLLAATATTTALALLLAASPATAATLEPANALSLPTWAIHVSSVVEWCAAMGLFVRLAAVRGEPAMAGMAWGMVPLLVSVCMEAGERMERSRGVRRRSLWSRGRPPTHAPPPSPPPLLGRRLHRLHLPLLLQRPVPLPHGRLPGRADGGGQCDDGGRGLADLERGGGGEERKRNGGGFVTKG